MIDVTQRRDMILPARGSTWQKKNVTVDPSGDTETHPESWVELQQINWRDMREVRCGVLDFNELLLCCLYIWVSRPALSPTTGNCRT